MEGLKDLLAPKTLHWLSYVANVLWILFGIILSPIFLDIENSEPTDFRCGSNDDRELIRGKCYEEYDKQYNKFPVYGFVIINFLVTASVCGIYSQAVKSRVEELERENNADDDVEGQTPRKKLFKAYCLQLLVRFVLGIFFLLLQTKLLYPLSFPSNFNCNLTTDGKFSDITAGASRNETQTQTSYECHNQRAAKKTVWAYAVIVVTGAFALLVFIESLYMLLCRARKVSFRAFTEDQEFHKCYLSSSKPTDEQVPRKTKRSDRDPLCHSDEGERLEEYPQTRENSQQTLPGDIFGAEKQKTLDVGRPGFGKTMFSTKILRNPASESLFPMATRNDGDVQDKGRRLWDALKNKKIDRVDRISIIGELLKNGAPVNFREPDRQVGNLKFINKVSVVIICRGITPHSYLRKKKHESARKSYPAHRQSIFPLRRIIALSLFIHDGGKL